MIGDMTEIYGIWVRSHHGKMQVLVETNSKEWRQVFLETADDTTSHIIEPAGIRRCPFVNVQGDFNPFN